jgi:hypothetical protein
METQGSNSSQRSYLVSRDGTHDRTNLPTIHPDACLAIRKQKLGLQGHSGQRSKLMANQCQAGCSTAWNSCSSTTCPILTIATCLWATHLMMTNAINSRTVMSKRDLYLVIRCHHNFSRNQVEVCQKTRFPPLVALTASGKSMFSHIGLIFVPEPSCCLAWVNDLSKNGGRGKGKDKNWLYISVC